MLACEGGNLPVAQWLYANNPDCFEVRVTLLGRFLGERLCMCSTPFVLWQIDFASPLHVAAARSCIEVMDWLVEVGIDIDILAGRVCLFVRCEA